MYILATGMICPVGLSAAPACAAMRAGIARFEEIPYYHSGGEWVVAAFVKELGFDLEDPGRLIEMLVRSIEDCLDFTDAPLTEEMPLLVGFPESGRAGIGAGLADSVVGLVEGRLGIRFHSTFSCAIPKGHTAGFEAIREAKRLMDEDNVSACMVCAVDSYVNADSLAWLEQNWRLKTDEYSDGVIPGEAAAAVLVLRDCKAADGAAAVRIGGIGFSQELASVLSDQPLRADGLTVAAATALREAGYSMREISFRLSDVTGEQYGFKEQGLTLIRLLNEPADDMPIWHFAESIGDIGATAGICELVMAHVAFSRGYTPGPRVMCFCSGVLGDRSALVLEQRLEVIAASMSF